MKVGYALEERVPIRPDLFSTTEAPIWMNGLLTSVIRMEARDKRLQVMLVHSTVKTLQNFFRFHFHLGHMPYPLLPLPTVNPVRPPPFDRLANSPVLVHGS